MEFGEILEIVVLFAIALELFALYGHTKLDHRIDEHIMETCENLARSESSMSNLEGHMNMIDEHMSRLDERISKTAEHLADLDERALGLLTKQLLGAPKPKPPE